MNTSRREHVKELLARAASLPAHERSAFIRRSAGEDHAAAAEALDLLATLDDSAFMSAPTGAAPIGLGRRGSGICEAPGTHIDRYKLLQLIGEGGFGSVFMAEQTEPVKRHVALKIIKAGMDTRQVIARFEAERQALALMDHPSIAKVLDAGATESGRPYFVMELVRGEPITRFCDRRRLAVQGRLELFRDVCRAVQHAHQKGIIHRDLKPTNVLVTIADGAPLAKVIDFGIAKAIAARLTDKTLFTEFHQLVGTPEYMSPEQAEIIGVDIDTRSDVYSLGVLLYELLTGTTPFDRRRLYESGFDGMRRILRDEEPPRPSLRLRTLASSSHYSLPSPAEPAGQAPASSIIAISHDRGSEPVTLSRALRGDLDRIVMKCLAKDRSRRYETASALTDDIGRYLNHDAVSAMPPSIPYKLRKFARRNRGTVIAGGSVVTALLIATGVSLWFGIGEARSRRAAEASGRRAVEAEAEASARADELEQVAKFQRDQLAGIDARSMGMQIRAGLLERARVAAGQLALTPGDVEARINELENLIAGSDFTGLALESLEANVLQPALAAIEKQFANQPQVKARLLQALASTQRELGLLDAASAVQEEALAIRRRTLGDDHPDTVTSINHMAALLRAQGQFANAESVLHELLETSRRVLGEEHPDTLSAIASIGLLLQDQGRLVEAEHSLREVLGKQRCVLGNEHPETLNSLNTLGMVLQEQGKLPEAERCLRESLEARRATLGSGHAQTLHSINNMAILLQALGRLSEAEAYFREALEMRRSVLGEEHPDTLTSMENMGVLLQAQGRLAEAESYHRRVLEASRRILGDEHPDTLSSINNMAMLLKDEGKLAEAEEYCREALEKRRRVLGNEHTHTLISLSNFGILLQSQGRLSEAEPLFREALETSRRVMGDEDIDTLVAINNMGVLLKDQGRFAEAEPYCREALNGIRRSLGEGHSSTLTLTANLGRVLHAQGKFSEAVGLLAPAEPAARRAFVGGNAYRLGRFLSVLGRVRAEAGEFDAAQSNLGEAHELLRAAGDSYQRERAEAIQGLVTLYEAWHAAEPHAGYDAKAEEWRKTLPRMPHE